MSVDSTSDPTRDGLRPFPVRSGRLLVPVSSRAAALAALAMYPACRPAAAAGQRAARALVRLLGPRALPGRGLEWTPPVPLAEWAGLLEEWRSAVGAFDASAVLRRSAGDDGGFALLLFDGGAPRAFVKLRPDGGPVRAEIQALEALNAVRPSSFTVPKVMAQGEGYTWGWLALSPLPPRVHRPFREPDLDAVGADIERALGGQPRPAGTPEEWRPMHGDLTPWNLRRLSGRTWLLDWESAGWGPPGADRVLYRATAAALAGRPAAPSPFSDAVAFWRRMVDASAGSPRDQRLADALDRALAGMAG